MPKINEYININKKPVEIVHEIKNEKEYQVPSFEEFMKDYKSDSKVNDSYENELKGYGDISVRKSYGPGLPGDNYFVKNDWWWGEWEHLEIPCIAEGCSGSASEQWFHNREECSHAYQRILWSSRGGIKCVCCDKASHISNWFFKCHRCAGYGNNYDKKKFSEAIDSVRRTGKISKSFAEEVKKHIDER